ncbi:OLC1v1029970C1 [Oldenlandia corymbosa var. corymbosa]|uniref:OLC1v1029970C1 n=1 Tax=Oldenlandia corymbosa var. corymbosa TaxID=529605 RepID=A0AAV1CEX7_OLDCO|nr:OLC1v1029970C1 [Oldenlandia corymbosa var. corymbosa]
MGGDFPFLSDSDEDKAVNELLSQAMDQCVLEQVVAINCSGFNDSGLPSHLETRFQKLKSLPSSGNPKPKPPVRSQSQSASSSSEFKRSIEDKSIPNSQFCLPKDAAENGLPLDSKKNSVVDEEGSKGVSKSGVDGSKDPKLEKCLKGNPLESRFSGEEEPSSDSFDFLGEKDDIFSSFSTKKVQDGKKRRGFKSPSDSSAFPSENSSSESLSPPPRRSGCLWCSPKRSPRRKNDGILSDLNGSRSFRKAQEKLLKMAAKEEEKISREAEKIVKWAKQASSRMMEVSGIEEDGLSDNEL